MIKTDTKVEGNKVIQTTQWIVDFDEIYNIISYLEEQSYEIIFENGNSEDHYNNLLDYTGVFKYESCECMLNYGLLYAVSYNGNSVFSLADDYKRVYSKIKRSIKINQITDD